MEEETGNIKRKEEAPAAGWEMIYCSLILIIVALFAMLVSYSTVKKERIDVFQKRKVFITTGDKPYETTDRPSLAQDMWVRQDIGLSGSGGEAFVKYLTDAGLDKSVRIEKIEKGFRVIFGTNVLFPSGEAEINKEAYPCLDKLIEIAQEKPFFVRVEGHTDNIPINTPMFPSNWELSTTRAVNILRYLIDKGRLSADRLAAVGFSQFQPVASNIPPEGRQKNRRVEFYFEHSSWQAGPEALNEE